MNRYEKQRELAIAGFVAPIIGLALTSILDSAEAITLETATQYSKILWAILVFVEIALIYDDVKSIIVNGPVFAICFLSSYNWLNGMDLREILLIDAKIMFVAGILGLIVMYWYENYYEG